MRNNSRSKALGVTCRRSQRGVALITAILVVALASVAAAAMMTADNIALQRSANIFQNEAASWYATGLEQWAGTILRRDRQHNQTDDLHDIWARNLGQLPVQGGYVTGRITDVQGLFNLNNLLQGDGQRQLKALQRLINIVLSQDNGDGSNPDTSGLGNAVKDWIDLGRRVSYPGGAEDGYYLERKPAYRAANRPMVSPSELLLVRGFTRKIYRALRPYVTVLPAGTKLNVNTAPWPVLAATIPAMGAERAKACVKYRSNHPFKSVQEFLAQPECVPGGSRIKNNNLSVSSHYFLAVGHAEVGDGRITLYSLLHRQNNGTTRVIAHSRGVF
jgi:general secretion pathway protein K